MSVKQKEFVDLTTNFHSPEELLGGFLINIEINKNNIVEICYSKLGKYVKNLRMFRYGITLKLPFCTTIKKKKKLEFAKFARIFIQ